MNVTHLHIEASSYCNARCPGCPRNAYGYPLEGFYKEAHFTPARLSEILEKFPNVQSILYCGNHGDPMMNPDGRARFAKSLQEYRGTAPNYDDQALLHTGDWPYGRTNHYFFDLNRDWIYLTQPETQGRGKLINEWSPQI